MDDKTIKIAIIDSGVGGHYEMPHIKEKITVFRNDIGEIQIQTGAEDMIGHGTAVAYLIASEVPDAEYYIIKIFDNSMYTSEEVYEKALKYCIDIIKPQIIHLSNGITCCENLNVLRGICSEAVNNGSVIIAAFDNFGSISYPAAFESVLGVDVSDDIKEGYVWVEHDGVNILVPNLTHKVIWVNGDYFISNGTSFNACMVTIMVAKVMLSGVRGRTEICQYLKTNAMHRILPDVKGKYEKEIELDIKKAVIFPFNKELHSLIRFRNNLSFEIVKIYDVKYMRQVNKFPEDIIGIGRTEKSVPIESIDCVDWEYPFDTFIVGHVKEMEKSIKRDYIHYIAEKCIEHSKSLVSLTDFSGSDKYGDRFREKGLKLYIPQIGEKDIPDLFRKKLRRIGIPVLGVFGTSSRQGKFTLQVHIRNYFQNNGYKVGQLGTEPTSILFGFDEVFPMGYESTVTVEGLDSIAVINNMMGKIEDKNPDIIIVGSQSQTIPQNLGNLSLYILEQHSFLLATEPDAVILCINLFDEEEYIERTIKYIEAIVDARVIALSVFPMNRMEMGGILTNKLLPADKGDIKYVCDRFAQRFHRPVFAGGEDINKLGKICESFFT